MPFLNFLAEKVNARLKSALNPLPLNSPTIHHPVIHFEIGCRDLQKTSDFYTKLFNWTPTPVGPATYIQTNTLEGIQGHLNALGHEPYHYVTIYIQTDDIKEHLIKIVEAGGSTLIGPIKIPNGQEFAWFKDLDGNVLGLLTKA